MIFFEKNNEFHVFKFWIAKLKCQILFSNFNFYLYIDKPKECVFYQIWDWSFNVDFVCDGYFFLYKSTTCNIHCISSTIEALDIFADEIVLNRTTLQQLREKNRHNVFDEAKTDLIDKVIDLSLCLCTKYYEYDFFLFSI